jgi:hypothetical protein
MAVVFEVVKQSAGLRRVASHELEVSVESDREDRKGLAVGPARPVQELRQGAWPHTRAVASVCWSSRTRAAGGDLPSDARDLISGTAGGDATISRRQR